MPDDVWLSLCHGFSLHVNQNAEKLRQLFVRHQGKQDIKVYTPPPSPLVDPAKWPGVIDMFLHETSNRVAGDVGSVLSCDFSTTGPVERAVAGVSVMTTFQKYFTYKCYTFCGIRGVLFGGTIDDWRHLRAKADALRKYDCEQWVNSVLIMLDKFIDTYNGTVDLEFWRGVAHIYSTHGSGASTHLLGWICNFWPYSVEGKPQFRNWTPRTPAQIAEIAEYKRRGEWGGDDEGTGGGSAVYDHLSTEPQDIPEMVFTVPFLLDDKPYAFRAGFTGLLYEGGAFRPQLGYAVLPKATIDQEMATKEENARKYRF
eukprot:TRINITY_DN7151_c0_g2_i1.p1 TRINITY_DN7151_c0_g2~~TRINITY_DN7151_c0_g2_i1.p1  ORF type:complete len:313 (-),score=87.72 TRINITY_DN7151_c0_g2_i1:77-1015(-)